MGLKKALLDQGKPLLTVAEFSSGDSYRGDLLSALTKTINFARASELGVAQILVKSDGVTKDVEDELLRFASLILNSLQIEGEKLKADVSKIDRLRLKLTITCK